jgi:hypothetical protein
MMNIAGKAGFGRRIGGVTCGARGIVALRVGRICAGQTGRRDHHRDRA